jgi:hypothetical protein
MARPSRSFPTLARTAVAIVAGLALLAPTAATTASAKDPSGPRMLASTKIDAHLGYMPQTTCSPSAKPGAKALLKLLIKTWGGSSSGISRGCGVGARSEHKEGRALDWRMSVKKASQRKRVNTALTWITANNGEVALRLGIMYVIWNQHIWSVYYPELGWRKMADRGSVTANHKNHVHISLSWDGAYQQTSWWTGVPIASPLNGKCGTKGARACLPVVGRGSGAAAKAEVPASFTPAPWVKPGVGGSPQVGREQRAVAGSWVPDGAEVTYQWTSDGKPIAGATASTYVIPPEQVGHEVEVRVTATAGGTSTTKASDNIADVYPARFSAPVPKIAGTATVGATLTAATGEWKPAASKLTYRWLRNGKKIKGATAATYVLTAADARKKIQVEVTGSALGYATLTKTSAKLKVVG